MAYDLSLILVSFVHHVDQTLTYLHYYVVLAFPAYSFDDQAHDSFVMMNWDPFVMDHQVAFVHPLVPLMKMMMMVVVVQVPFDLVDGDLTLNFVAYDFLVHLVTLMKVPYVLQTLDYSYDLVVVLTYVLDHLTFDY